MADYDLDNLKCDKIKEKTKIAQEYLKMNSDIRGLGPGVDPGSHVNEFVLDKCKNKIFFTVWEKVDKSYRPEKFNGEKLSIIFKALAEKIENNEELISQLDFMMRDYPFEDSKSHILLIVNQLLSWSTELSTYLAPNKMQHLRCGVLVMNESIPLLSLGCLPSMLIEHENVIIQTTKETAALCFLFTKLCHEVGLQLHLTLACVEENQLNDNLLYYDFNQVEGARSGCTGLVLERSDMDSGLDMFLASSEMSPWKLKRILVQESVYERFKETLELKCRRKNEELDLEPYLDGACADVFMGGKKVFVVGEGGEGELETLGEEVADCLIVHVEAFRTIKEVMTLVPENKTFYVSVWASNITEANEISSEIDVSLVWLNQYAMFTGSPYMSQCIYSRLCQQSTTAYVDEEFENLRKTWYGTDNRKLRSIIYQALNNHLSDNEYAKRLKDSYDRADRKCFVEFEPGTMIVGIEAPIGVIGRADIMDEEVYFHMAMSSVIVGNSLVYSESVKMDDEALELLKMLRDAGVPITSYREDPSDDKKTEVKVLNTLNFFRIKIIWTIFGTLFAH